MDIRPEIALAAFAAALLATSVTGAYAVGAATAGAPYVAQQEPPKDCKLKPEDPRCKADRKG